VGSTAIFRGAECLSKEGGENRVPLDKNILDEIARGGKRGEKSESNSNPVKPGKEVICKWIRARRWSSCRGERLV